MTVLLTVSATWDGDDFEDNLEGGGLGIDLGSVVNSQYAPIISQAANTGAKDVYVRHDAAIDPVTNVKTFVQEYGVGTSFTYGGANSAALDYTKLLDMGNLDAMGAGVNNNSDGLGNGLHIEMDWDVNTSNQFLGSRKGTFKQVYGSDGGAASGNGRDLATAFPMKSDAMSNSQGNGSETAPTAAVDGTIGRDFAVDSTEAATLGDLAHFKLRFFLRENEIEGGTLQWEYVIGYSFTA